MENKELFTMVQDQIIQRYGWVGAGVYSKIARYCSWSQKGVCTVSNERMARELALSVSTIRRWKNRLEKDHMIEVEKVKGACDLIRTPVHYTPILKSEVSDILEPTPILKNTPPYLKELPPLSKRADPPILKSEEESIKDTIKNIEETGRRPSKKELTAANMAKYLK